MVQLDLIFMGSADFAVPSLQAVLAAGHRVRVVYAQPPKPAGRGHKERPCPVHAFAAAQGLPVRTPKSLRAPAEAAAFAAFQADAAVVAAYGLLLPKTILDAMRLGCFNVHASLLPRWRGAAPIQRALLAGDRETGVTIMRMDEGLDTGPILLKRAVPIEPTTTAAALHDVLAALGATLIVEALDGVATGTLTPVPQPSDGVIYAAKLTRDEGRIDWRQPAHRIERQVRALNPWPGVWFDHAGERIKVLDAIMVPGAGVPGTALDAGLTVACGEDAIRLTRVQRAGRAPMEAGAFLRGFPIPSGTVLG
jgi:methionyl-tRNA formyltransferase